MALTEAQLQIMEQAIVDRKGALSLGFDDQSITFESAAAAQAWIDAQRQRLNGATIRFATYSKGV